jgi:hypothetical protein
MYVALQVSRDDVVLEAQGLTNKTRAEWRLRAKLQVARKSMTTVDYYSKPLCTCDFFFFVL